VAPSCSSRSKTPPSGTGLLYPSLSPGASGLAKRSVALNDHLRSIDKRRARMRFDDLPSDEPAAVDVGLSVLLGLGGP
jgi:mRNA-degrading endonuclease toxin of MazEF toxin-antitoxin module